MHTVLKQKVDFIYLIICTSVRSRIRANHEYFMMSKYCILKSRRNLVQKISD